MRRILVLANPLMEKKSRALPRIVDALGQAGARVEASATTPSRGAGEQARRAVADGVDCIVVCGGDGTVFDVLQGMAGSTVALGIVPFGTGNILAQNLKIPKDPVAAARWLLAARPRPIPLGKLSLCKADGSKLSWFFAMTAGMGVHAAMMTASVRARKNVGGRAAYFVAGLQLLFRHPLEPFDLEITTTDHQVMHRRVCEAIAVRVAELNIWRPGGGFELPFLRLATVESGSMETAQHGSRWQLGRAAVDGLFLSAGERGRRQRRNAPARYEDVLRVVFRPAPGFDYKEPLSIQADGEVIDGSCAVIEMAGVGVQMLSAAE